MRHLHTRLIIIIGITLALGGGGYALVWNWHDLDDVINTDTSREDILKYMSINGLSCNENMLIWANRDPDSDLGNYVIKKYEK